MALAGHLNQGIDQYRRELFKLSICNSMQRIAKDVPEEDENLFRDNLEKRAKELQESEKALESLKASSTPENTPLLRILIRMPTEVAVMTLIRVGAEDMLVPALMGATSRNDTVARNMGIKRETLLEDPKEGKQQALEGQNVSDITLFSISQLKVYLQNKVISFQAGCLNNHLRKWMELTTDQEILTTVSGLRVESLHCEGFKPTKANMSYPVSSKHSEVISNEITKLLKKKVVTKSTYETSEIVSPIFPVFLRGIADGNFRMILKLKTFYCI